MNPTFEEIEWARAKVAKMLADVWMCIALWRELGA